LGDVVAVAVAAIMVDTATREKMKNTEYAKKTCSLQWAGEGKKRGEKIQNTQEKNTWQIVVCNGSQTSQNNSK